MTKQEALQQLHGTDSTPNAELADRVRLAIEHGASVAEIASELTATPEEIKRSFPGAISEAGRIGHFRHPAASPYVTDAPERLYVADRT